MRKASKKCELGRLIAEANLTYITIHDLEWIIASPHDKQYFLLLDYIGKLKREHAEQVIAVHKLMDELEIEY